MPLRLKVVGTPVTFGGAASGVMAPGPPLGCARGRLLSPRDGEKALICRRDGALKIVQNGWANPAQGGITSSAGMEQTIKTKIVPDFMYDKREIWRASHGSDGKSASGS